MKRVVSKYAAFATTAGVSVLSRTAFAQVALPSAPTGNANPLDTFRGLIEYGTEVGMGVGAGIVVIGLIIYGINVAMGNNNTRYLIFPLIGGGFLAGVGFVAEVALTGTGA